MESPWYLRRSRRVPTISLKSARTRPVRKNPRYNPPPRSILPIGLRTDASSHSPPPRQGIRRPPYGFCLASGTASRTFSCRVTSTSEKRFFSGRTLAGLQLGRVGPIGDIRHTVSRRREQVADFRGWRIKPQVAARWQRTLLYGGGFDTDRSRSGHQRVRLPGWRPTSALPSGTENRGNTSGPLRVVGYDAAPDGKWFVVNSPPAGNPPPITLITNWTPEPIK